MCTRPQRELHAHPTVCVGAGAYLRPYDRRHIKLHGSSNHYFLPTGLLQAWLAEASPRDPALGPLADFAGGVVRVEASTSAFLNANYPGETLMIEPEPAARQTLLSVGHVGRLFTNPGARARNIRGKNLQVRGRLPHIAAAPHTHMAAHTDACAHTHARAA